MSRQFLHFACGPAQLAATLDLADGPSGLLIVSGGNEIRAGSHAGMAELARQLAFRGISVFRYDRRGIGDSDGENRGFLESREDIASAMAECRARCPDVRHWTAFGNCDAATALALFSSDLAVDQLILANPWVIEQTEQSNAQPAASLTPAAIRARYWNRLKNPRSLLDLLTGKINIRKMLSGLARATQTQENGDLAKRLQQALEAQQRPIRILLAAHDSTARAFLAAWNSPDYRALRQRQNITVATRDTASHGFANPGDKTWLVNELTEIVKKD